MFVSSGSAQVEGEHGQACAPPHGGGERVDEDRVLLDWLRERPEHPRCSALLRQIMEWIGKCQKPEMRSLAKAQGITIRRQEDAHAQKFREAVRRHFKTAVAQEKGCLACFQLPTTRDTSEHSHSLAREAEHVLNVAEVVDLRTLSLFP